MNYYILWLSAPYQDDESEHVCHTEGEAIAFINNTVASHPAAVFRVYFGRKIDLEPAEVIRSYRFKRL